jgi:excisionase family DNA binding protein
MTDIGSHSQARALNMRLMTPSEVAVFLRISKNGVYRLVERRVIRFYRLRGVLRFDQQDIEAFLKQGCVEPMGR